MSSDLLPDWPTTTKAEKERIILEHLKLGWSNGKIAGLFFDCSRNKVAGFIHRESLQKVAPRRRNKFDASVQMERGKRAESHKAPKPKGATSSKPAQPRSRKSAVSELPKPRPPVTRMGMAGRAGHLNSANIRNKRESRASDPGIALTIDRQHYFDPLPGTKPVDIRDLPRFGKCRWPVNGIDGREPIFCEQTIDPTATYCAVHRRLAFTSATMRREGD
jgi:hypothetical protein